MPKVKNPLRTLRHELDFLQKGYYRTPLGWRWPLFFEDSPICLKNRSCACPTDDCVLMGFVPSQAGHEAAPCRYIPLNEIGETLDSLYRTGTNEQIEQAPESWLLKSIRELEQEQVMSSGQEKAA